MKEMPSRFNLPAHPSEYLKQGASHCGAYSVKGILSANGVDRTDHPKEYHPHLLGRLTGLTLGRKYWPKILDAYGFEASPESAAHLEDEDKLLLLKGLLLDGNPVMVSIGNGYLPNGEHSRLLGKIVGHWITVWGYDDEESVFYVYDSAVPIDRHSKELPVGNITRTYDEMIRDWEGGLLSLARGIEGFHYIKVSQKE